MPQVLLRQLSVVLKVFQEVCRYIELDPLIISSNDLLICQPLVLACLMKSSLDALQGGLPVLFDKNLSGALKQLFFPCDFAFLFC